MKMQNVGQMGKMLSSITEMQKKMDLIQKELAEAVYEGEAGGGLAKVKITGKGDLVGLELSPALLTEDADTVSDIIRVAHKKAFEAKEAAAKQKLGTLTAGMLPFGLKIPGLG